MARPKPNLTEEQLKARSAMWVQKWRDKNPEKQVLARKRAYFNRKVKALNLVGGAVCVNCGCTEVDFLEFNHKSGGGCKEWRSDKNTPMMDRLLTNNRRADDLEVLCRVCNALDFLRRKNSDAARHFNVRWDVDVIIKRWEDYTGNKATKLQL